MPDFFQWLLFTVNFIMLSAAKCFAKTILESIEISVFGFLQKAVFHILRIDDFWISRKNVPNEKIPRKSLLNKIFVELPTAEMSPALDLTNRNIFYVLSNHKPHSLQSRSFVLSSNALRHFDSLPFRVPSGRMLQKTWSRHTEFLIRVFPIRRIQRQKIFRSPEEGMLDKMPALKNKKFTSSLLTICFTSSRYMPKKRCSA